MLLVRKQFTNKSTKKKNSKHGIFKYYTINDVRYNLVLTLVDPSVLKMCEASSHDSGRDRIVLSIVTYLMANS